MGGAIGRGRDRGISFDSEIIAIGAEPGVIQITTEYNIRTYQITDITHQEMHVKDNLFEITYLDKRGTYSSNLTTNYLYADELESKIKKALVKAYTIQYKKIKET